MQSNVGRNGDKFMMLLPILLISTIQTKNGISVQILFLPQSKHSCKDAPNWFRFVKANCSSHLKAKIQFYQSLEVQDHLKLLEFYSK